MLRTGGAGSAQRLGWAGFMRRGWRGRATDDMVPLPIRWRLVGLFLALALASTAVFLGGLQRAAVAGCQTWAQPLLGDYVDRLAAEIGSPPDPARAAALQARLPLRVRIDGPVVRFGADRRPRAADRIAGLRRPGWKQRSKRHAEQEKGKKKFHSLGLLGGL